MTANAGVAAVVATRSGSGLSTLGAAGCGLYAAYGVRLSTYLLRRQMDASYTSKWLAVQEKSDKMGMAKLAVVTGVGRGFHLPQKLCSASLAPSTTVTRPAAAA